MQGFTHLLERELNTPGLWDVGRQEEEGGK
jgi:hypothetical protein